MHIFSVIIYLLSLLSIHWSPFFHYLIFNSLYFLILPSPSHFLSLSLYSSLWKPVVAISLFFALSLCSSLRSIGAVLCLLVSLSVGKSVCEQCLLWQSQSILINGLAASKLNYLAPPTLSLTLPSVCGGVCVSVCVRERGGFHPTHCFPELLAPTVPTQKTPAS